MTLCTFAAIVVDVRSANAQPRDGADRGQTHSHHPSTAGLARRVLVEPIRKATKLCKTLVAATHAFGVDFGIMRTFEVKDMLRRRFQATLVAAAFAIFGAPGAFGEGGAPAWSGTWGLSGGSADEAARSKEIEDAIAGLPSFKRGVARSRLGQRLAPPKRLALKLSGSEVEVIQDGKSMRLPANGKAKSVETASGKATAKAEQAEAKLIVTATGENGTLRTVYERADNTLRMTVELTAELLPQPVRVSSTYTPVP